MRKRVIGPVMVAVAMTLGAACEDPGPEGGIDHHRGQVSATPAGQPSVSPEQRVSEIIIHSSWLNPARVVLPAGVETRLDIANRSGRECQFFLGSFVNPTAIRDGEVRAVSFTVPSEEAQPGALGCRDDPNRQGGYTVEPGGSSQP